MLSEPARGEHGGVLSPDLSLKWMVGCHELIGAGPHRPAVNQVQGNNLIPSPFRRGCRVTPKGTIIHPNSPPLN